MGPVLSKTALPSLSSRYIPVRTRTIVEQLTVTDIALSDELAKRLQESGYRWFKSDLQYALWAEKACEAPIARVMLKAARSC